MSSPSPYTCVLWDVDGTLVDGSEGILRRLIRAHRDYGLEPPTIEEMVHWIGPPMHETFQRRHGLSPEQAAELTAHYRAIGKEEGYATGARLYPGVGELVTHLAEAGVTQATASSKPENQVRALMDRFALTDRLQVIVGSTTDNTRSSKADVLTESLRRLEEAGYDTSRPVLIGDRHHDVDGAAVHGIPVIFVRWGFAEPGEEAGAVAVVDTAEELEALLLPGADTAAT